MTRTAVSCLLILLLLSSVAIPFTRVYANETAADQKGTASEAISKAEKSLGEAENAIHKAKEIGANMTRVEALFELAHSGLQEARAAHEKGNYEAALLLAKQAIENASAANRQAQEAYKRTLELRTKTERQIGISSKALAELSTIVNEAEKKGVNASRVKPILHEAEETMGVSKKVFAEKNYERALELAVVAFELVGKAKNLLTSNTQTDLNPENILRQVRERLEKIRALITEAEKHGVDTEKAQARLEQAIKMINELEEAIHSHDDKAYHDLSAKVSGLLGETEALLRTASASLEAKRSEEHRFEELLAKTRRIIEEVKRTLSSQRAGDEASREVQKKLGEIIDGLERSVQAFKAGNKDRAFAIAKETFEAATKILKLIEKLPDRAELAAKELRQAHEKITHAEKALAEMKQTNLNTSRIQEALKQAAVDLRRAYDELKNGNATIAHSIAVEVQRNLEKAFEEFKEQAKKEERRIDQRELESTVQRIKNARDEVLQKMEKAKANGINVVPIQNVLDAASNIQARAEEFLSSGQTTAGQALLKVTEKLIVDASRLIDLLAEHAKKTEVAKSERKTTEKDDKLRVERSGNKTIQVDSERNRVKLNLETPRIQYAVRQGEKTVEFQSKIHSLAEFNDNNGDGLIQNEEVLQRLSFGDAKWEAEEKTEGNMVIVTYRAYSERYDVSLILKVYEQSSIEFFKNDEKTVVYSVDGGAREVKFDIMVTKWPWKSNSSSLALRMKTEADVKDGVRVEKVSDDEQRLIVDSGGVLVKVKWIPKAIIQEPDGVQRIVNIGIGHAVNKEANELDVDFIYPNFNGLVLIHDPSIGVAEPSLPPTPQESPAEVSPRQSQTLPQTLDIQILGPIIVLAVVVAGIIMIRKRRSGSDSSYRPAQHRGKAEDPR